jgi:hypothetical protein
MNTDTLLARAQIGLAFLSLGGLMGMTGVLIFYHGTLDDKRMTLVVTLTTGLLAIAGQCVSFFVARHRPQAGTIPDPNGQDVSTSTTTTSIPKEIK